MTLQTDHNFELYIKSYGRNREARAMQSSCSRVDSGEIWVDSLETELTWAESTWPPGQVELAKKGKKCPKKPTLAEST